MPKFVVVILIIIFGVSVITAFRQKSISVLQPSPESTFKPGSAVIYHGGKGGRVIALTFDADMTPKMKNELLKKQVSGWYNKDIIKILREKHVPATLFLTGMWAEIYSKETQDLAADPLFEIENHSYSHPAFSSPCYTLRPIPDSSDAAEIEKTQKILFDLTGHTPHYFRFPGGCFDRSDVSKVQAEGLDVIQWDVASGDAFSTNSGAIVARVLGKVKPGSIVVMHMMGGPNAPVTAKALPVIIEKLQKEGYGFAKLSDILN